MLSRLHLPKGKRSSHITERLGLLVQDLRAADDDLRAADDHSRGRQRGVRVEQPRE